MNKVILALGIGAIFAFRLHANDVWVTPIGTLDTSSQTGTPGNPYQASTASFFDYVMGPNLIPADSIIHLMGARSKQPTI